MSRTSSPAPYSYGILPLASTLLSQSYEIFRQFTSAEPPSNCTDPTNLELTKRINPASALGDHEVAQASKFSQPELQPLSLHHSASSSDCKLGLITWCNRRPATPPIQGPSCILRSRTSGFSFLPLSQDWLGTSPAKVLAGPNPNKTLASAKQGALHKKR